MKKYLITWVSMFPGFRTFTQLKNLTPIEKSMVKDNVAKLFTVVNGEIKEIYLNGKIK